MSESQDRKTLANPAVVLREEFDDWAILFDQDVINAYGVNPIGVIIWKCLDGKHSVQDIKRVVCERCKNVPEDATNHIQGFIDMLIEHSLAGYIA